MSTFTLLIIFTIILCLFALIIIKNISSKNKNLKENKNLIDSKKSINSENKTSNENIIIKEVKESIFETTYMEDEFKNGQNFFSNDKNLVNEEITENLKDANEKSKEVDVNNSNISADTLNIKDKNTKEIKKDSLNQNEEVNDLRKRKKKNQAKQSDTKDLEKMNLDLSDEKNNQDNEMVDIKKTEVKAQSQIGEENLEPKEEIASTKDKEFKVKKAHIKEVEDFINNIEDINSLKESSPKLCQREDYDSDLDFHKSITTGGMDEFDKNEIQINPGDYNLFEVVEFIKNTNTTPTKINKKKALTLQYSSTDKEDIKKIIANNRINDIEKIGLLNEKSSINSTILIDKETNKITEVTDSINYNDSKRTIFSKIY